MEPTSKFYIDNFSRRSNLKSASTTSFWTEAKWKMATEPDWEIGWNSFWKTRVVEEYICNVFLLNHCVRHFSQVHSKQVPCMCPGRCVRRKLVLRLYTGLTLASWTNGPSSLDLSTFCQHCSFTSSLPPSSQLLELPPRWTLSCKATSTTSFWTDEKWKIWRSSPIETLDKHEL